MLSSQVPRFADRTCRIPHVGPVIAHARQSKSQQDEHESSEDFKLQIVFCDIHYSCTLAGDRTPNTVQRLVCATAITNFCPGVATSWPCKYRLTLLYTVESLPARTSVQCCRSRSICPAHETRNKCTRFHPASRRKKGYTHQNDEKDTKTPALLGL